MTTRQTLTATEQAFVERLRVGRLATADAKGRPHVVPVCYAYDGERFYTPLDEKPKAVPARALRRVRNVLARGEAALVIDHYEDDWSRLGYVLVAGRAALLEAGAPGHAAAVALLRARYAPYRAMALETLPLLELVPEQVSSWGMAATPDAHPQPGGDWLAPGRGVDLVAVARGRRSVRTFAARPVPRPALEAMLEAACWAPSPHGRQPWRFVVLTGDESKRRLAAAMGSEWQATLEMDGEPAEIVARRLLRSRERIESAPALILACLYLTELDRYPDAERQRAEEVMAVQSLGAAIQTMLLTAYAQGLETGWMCAPLFAPEAVRQALALPADLLPHALIPVGYLGKEPQRRPHRLADDLALWLE